MSPEWGSGSIELCAVSWTNPIKISTARFSGDKERIVLATPFTTPFAQVLYNSTRSRALESALCTHSKFTPVWRVPLSHVPRGLNVRLGICNAFSRLWEAVAFDCQHFHQRKSQRAANSRTKSEKARAERERQNTFAGWSWSWYHSFDTFSFSFPSAAIPAVAYFFVILLLLAFVY